MVDVLFRKQDSLGLKPWAGYATEAGVPDTAAFNACASTTTATARIDEGLRIGNAIGVRGTPTIVVNGWKFPLAPDEGELNKRIKSLLNQLQKQKAN